MELGSFKHTGAATCRLDGLLRLPSFLMFLCATDVTTSSVIGEGPGYPLPNVIQCLKTLKLFRSRGSSSGKSVARPIRVVVTNSDRKNRQMEVRDYKHMEVPLPPRIQHDFLDEQNERVDCVSGNNLSPCGRPTTEWRPCGPLRRFLPTEQVLTEHIISTADVLRVRYPAAKLIQRALDLIMNDLSKQYSPPKPLPPMGRSTHISILWIPTPTTMPRRSAVTKIHRLIPDSV
ncbi:hypothetical protein E2C01_029788 [Portunus trituberculatus]|uniref:Uncharacterized protein n=1 Tax=Portunus trituberculatus TaxID=210409 RepID=A0A5B7ETV0_PORTR|nr:hypothetical protein [Portunus trituberculatus]